MTTPPSQLGPAIRRARLDQLTIFEISESELEALERGAPESLHLNLAIAALSSAVSFTVTLWTTTITSDRVYLTIFLVTFVLYIAFVAFGLFWFRARSTLKSVSEAIRGRIPPEGIQEPQFAAPADSRSAS